jgi:hypothetical protein
MHRSTYTYLCTYKTSCSVYPLTPIGCCPSKFLFGGFERSFDGNSVGIVALTVFVTVAMFAYVDL